MAGRSDRSYSVTRRAHTRRIGKYSTRHSLLTSASSRPSRSQVGQWRCMVGPFSSSKGRSLHNATGPRKQFGVTLHGVPSGFSRPRVTRVLPQKRLDLGDSMRLTEHMACSLTVPHVEDSCRPGELIEVSTTIGKRRPPRKDGHDENANSACGWCRRDRRRTAHARIDGDGAARIEGASRDNTERIRCRGSAGRR